MPPPINIPLFPPSLPPGYCFTSWQQLLIDFFTGAVGVFPGNIGTGFNFGNGVPSVNNQSLPWIRTDVNNALEGTYSFAFGKWVRPYRVPPGPNDERLIWGGSLTDLYNYDGGDGTDPTITPPTNITGSFWQADTVFACRMPIGAGTLPLSLGVINPGDLGGLELVSLDVKEMPPHSHQTVADGQVGKPPNKAWGSSADGSKTGRVYPQNDDGLVTVASAEVPITTTLADTGGDTSLTPVVVKAHQNLPPFVTVSFCNRTIRAYVTV